MPSLVIMKIILLILILCLSGCAEKYYPTDIDTTKIKYISDLTGQRKCSFCKGQVIVYKYTKSGKIICPKCFRKVRNKELYDR